MVNTSQLFSVVATAIMTVSSSSAFSTPQSTPVWGLQQAPRHHSSWPLYMSVPASSSTSITLDRPSTFQPQKSTDYDQTTDDALNPDGPYTLRLFDDNLNTKEWVARSLVYVVGLCEQDAYAKMTEAHTMGIAKVGDYRFDIAECYRREMLKNEIKCDVIPAEEC
jgi:ATP-dependent Clp protease adapter protein ClpS